MFWACVHIQTTEDKKKHSADEMSVLWNLKILSHFRSLGSGGKKIQTTKLGYVAYKKRLRTM